MKHDTAGRRCGVAQSRTYARLGRAALRVKPTAPSGGSLLAIGPRLQYASGTPVWLRAWSPQNQRWWIQQLPSTLKSRDKIARTAS